MPKRRVRGSIVLQLDIIPGTCTCVFALAHCRRCSTASATRLAENPLVSIFGAADWQSVPAAQTAWGDKVTGRTTA
jgi:hypothetical protein